MNIIDKPILSIVVPVYNVGTALDCCMNSLFVKQAFRSFEVILIDDGSTDDSGQRCESWGKKDSRVKVIHQKNQGQSVARNAGIRAAQGEYVLFVDPDDTILASALSEIVNEMTVTKSDVLVLRYMERGPQGKLLSSSDSDNLPWGTSVMGNEALLDFFHEKFYGYVWRFCYRLSVITENDILFPEGRLLEDIDFVYKVLACSRQVSFSNIDFYRYQVTVKPVGLEKAIKDCDSSITFIEECLRYIDEKNHDLIPDAAAYCIHVCLHYYAQTFHYSNDSSLQRSRINLKNLYKKMRHEVKLWDFPPKVRIACFLMDIGLFGPLGRFVQLHPWITNPFLFLKGDKK